MKSAPAWLKISPGNRRALALLLVAVVVAVYLFGIRTDMSDFGVCFQAGGRILAGETLYRASDGHLQFKYAPAAAMAYAPFSLLPWEAAKAVWFLVMAACLAGILKILSLWTRERGVPARGPLIWAVVVMAKCLGREFQLGQVNVLILLLLAVAARDAASGRKARAGLLWGLSLLFKPYGLIFLPYFMLKKNGRTLAFGAGSLLAGLLIPAVILWIHRKLDRHRGMGSDAFGFHPRPPPGRRQCLVVRLLGQSFPSVG